MRLNTLETYDEMSTEGLPQKYIFHNIFICPFSPVEETRTKESFSDFSHSKLQLAAWLHIPYYLSYAVIKVAFLVMHN